MKLTKHQIRVVHIPQVPMKGFVVHVKNEREAYLIDQTLSDQHIFLYEKNIIPDYANVICVQVWDDTLEFDKDGEKWTDYYNESENMEWGEFVEAYPEYVKA